MSNHPNRRRRGRRIPPANVREAREKYGISTADAAALVWYPEAVWIDWESGARAIPPAVFDYFCIVALGDGERLIDAIIRASAILPTRSS